MDAKIGLSVVLALLAGAANAQVHPEDYDPPLAMPPWLTPEGQAAPSGAVSDAFLVDEPPAFPHRLREPATPPAKTKAKARGPIQQVASWTPRLIPVTPRAEPIDKPVASSGTLARAEKLAQTARTRADLTKLIITCRHGKQPSPEFTGLLAWAYNRRGEMAAEDGDRDEALDDFARAIERDAEHWPAWHNRAITLAEMGRGYDAIADFDRVIELNPRLATAYRNRAETLGNLGRLKDAVFDYTAAIALGPVDAGLLAARGATHHRLGQIDRAVADFNLALQLDPTNPAALASRGDVYAQVGNYRQAIEDLELALQNDPTSAPACRSLAWLLATCPDADLRDPTQAVTRAKQAVRIAAESMSTSDPGDGDVALHLDTLAVALAGNGEFEAAVRHAEHAVEIAPAEYRAAMQSRLESFRRREAFVHETVRR